MDQCYQEGCTRANQRMRWLYGPCSHSHVGLDLALNPSYQNGSMFSKRKYKFGQVRMKEMAGWPLLTWSAWIILGTKS